MQPSLPPRVKGILKDPELFGDRRQSALVTANILGRSNRSSMEPQPAAVVMRATSQLNSQGLQRSKTVQCGCKALMLAQYQLPCSCAMVNLMRQKLQCFTMHWNLTHVFSSVTADGSDCTTYQKQFMDEKCFITTSERQQAAANKY